MKLRRIVALVAAALLALPGAALAAGTRTFFAMDTAVTLNADGAENALLSACEAEARRLEGLLSATRATSEISRLNTYGETTLSPDTRTVLKAALEAAELTDGALDVTVYPVARAWGFTTGSCRVPAQAELFRLLRNVNWRKVTLGEDSASVPEGVMVDLGALSRGYAADRLGALLRGGGVDSAIVEVGADVLCLGEKPDGSAWRVGIRDPKNPGGLAAIVSVRDRAVATSGVADRSFTGPDGRVYGHLFDPETGRPAESGLVSVTVIGSRGLLCDALSTAMCVMGRERAVKLLVDRPDLEAILVDDSDVLWITSGLKESFSAQGSYAGARIHWLR